MLATLNEKKNFIGETLRRAFRILKEKDRNESTKKDVTRQLHLQTIALQGSLRFLLCTSIQNRLHATETAGMRVLEICCRCLMVNSVYSCQDGNINACE